MCLQDEDGNLVCNRIGLDEEVLPSENIERVQQALQDLATLEENIKKAWDDFARIAKLDPKVSDTLAAGTLQRSQALVSKQHFNGRAALVKVICGLRPFLYAIKFRTDE